MELGVTEMGQRLELEVKVRGMLFHLHDLCCTEPIDLWKYYPNGQLKSTVCGLNLHLEPGPGGGTRELI